MALIERSLESAAAKLTSGPTTSGLLSQLKEISRKEFGVLAWHFFHEEDASGTWNIKKKILGIPFNVSVAKTVAWAIERLAGPDPTDGVVQPLGAA